VWLASRFAGTHPEIVDRLEAILADPVAAVRLQVAQDLQVLSVAAPDRMWAMGQQIASNEGDPEIVTAFLAGAMGRFGRSDPERCESILEIVKDRLGRDLVRKQKGRDNLQWCLGDWTAHLDAIQGRPLARVWLEEWAVDPLRYSDLLDSYSSSLRGVFFERYAPGADANALAVSERAQGGLAILLRAASKKSAEAYSVLVSGPREEDKQIATERYRAAESTIHHAMNQLYFGSGTFASDRKEPAGLPNPDAMARFLSDYSEILTLLSKSREPATLHHLIELYEFIIPGDPVVVFDAIGSILLGRGVEEGYHYESLGNTAVVRIVQRFIADYRPIFEDERRRSALVEILQLFSNVGWTDALRLLFELPELLR
jgi:hypothetical protein